ncbi:MAG: serine/threonine-protein kinase [Planctomycetota bacterium]
MIAINEHCLTTQQLRQFASGQLATGEFDSALRHLDHCERCQRSIEELDDSDEASGILSQSLEEPGSEPSGFDLDSQCQAAMRRLAERPTPLARADASIRQLAAEQFVPEQLGPYRLINVLGRGGMGTVFLAEHERLRRRCAVKVLSRHRSDDPAWLERFEREMTTVAALVHPNIVQASDAGQQDGWHYLVMEYLDGLDIGRIASRLDRLNVADACEMVRQAALALQHVHARGLIHRDIKPSNLLVSRDGTVKLLDLGLVLPGDDPLVVDERLTTVGHLMGTMAYMSPEQLVDSRDVTEKTDVYALGATLFRLITGRVPHRRSGGLGAQVLAMTGSPAPRLDVVAESVDARLADLVESMLAKQASQRPSSQEVAERMTDFSGDANLPALVGRAARLPDREPVTTSQATVLPNSDEKKPPRNWLGWIVGAVALAAVLLTIILKLQTETGELIIASQVDDVSVSIRQGEKLVERLELTRAGENRVTLRQGSYIVEIDGNVDDVRLSQNRVTIADGVESALSLFDESTPANETGALFQGKPYAYWLDLLKREQDMEGILQSMRAVELLSRGTDQRREAATETIRLARKWGGIVMGGGNPRHRFAEELGDIYYYYFPEPGLKVLVDELQQNNPSSTMSSTWTLNHYISGFLPKEVISNRPENSLVAIKRMAYGESEDRELFQSLVSELKRIADDFETKNSSRSSQIRTLAWTTLYKLIPVFDDLDSVPSWLIERIESDFQKNQEYFSELVKKNGGSTTAAAYAEVNQFGGSPTWANNHDAFGIIWKLHQAGRFQLDAGYASAMVGKRYIGNYWEWEKLVDLCEAIITEFDSGARLLRPFLREDLRKFAQPGMGGFATGLPIAALPYLEFTIELLAEDSEFPGVTQPVLQSFKQRLGREENQELRDALLEKLDAAIARQEELFQEKLKANESD